MCINNILVPSKDELLFALPQLTGCFILIWCTWTQILDENKWTGSGEFDAACCFDTFCSTRTIKNKYLPGKLFNGEISILMETIKIYNIVFNERWFRGWLHRIHYSLHLHHRKSSRLRNGLYRSIFWERGMQQSTEITAFPCMNCVPK